MQGFDLNLADYDGRTPLHISSSEGHIAIVKFLTNVVKVNCNIKDRWNRTALDDARTFKKKACVALLLKCDGLDVAVSGTLSPTVEINTLETEKFFLIRTTSEYK